MAGSKDVDTTAILEALGWDLEDDELRLRMAEMIGSLCLMVHWLRGIVYSMVFSGAVKFDPTWAKNFDVLYKSIDRHEAFVWEVAPPRGVLMQLRVLRRLGHLDEEWEKLLLGDDHGRIPRPEGEEDGDAKEILDRLIAADAKETPHDIHRLGG
jgi:hypothetical protein